MDAGRKSRIVNEAHDYILENWIYTEPFIQKIQREVDKISLNDPDLNEEENDKLKELKDILADMERDRPGINIKLPSAPFSLFKKQEKLPEKIPDLPNEIQKEIFSLLPFTERRRLARVSSAWYDFFNEIPIEKEYLFPKKSGGLIFFVEGKKPSIVKEILSVMNENVKSDIAIEINNLLTFKNNKELEHLEITRSNGISAYYTLFIPALFIMMLSAYYESNKMLYGTLVFFLLPLVMGPMGNSTFKHLKNEAGEKRDEAEQFLNRFKNNK